MSVTGVISNGVVVLPAGVSFPEGTKVEVISRESARQVPLPTPLAKNTFEPRDEWERLLLSAASDCGTSLSNEALGREQMYD